MLSDERIISALISTGTVKKAAQIAGTTPKTIYQRMKKKSFMDALQERQQMILDDGCKQLQLMLTQALQAIRSIINSQQSSDQVRLNASNIVLSNCLKYTEMIDIQHRLNNLERRYYELQKTD